MIGLIIPIHEYDNFILRPLRNIKKVGPVEFNQVDKFSYSGNLSTGIFNLKKNYINNGSFEIPLISKQSRWGTGQYSNKIKSYNPDEPVYFIKFGGVIASAEVVSDESISGHYSLHIKQESPGADNSEGLLEQEIYLEPGEYVLSLKAKVKYSFNNAIWIRLDKGWVGESGFDIPGNNIRSVPDWSLYQYRFKIDKDGFLYRFCNESDLHTENYPYVKTGYQLAITLNLSQFENGYLDNKQYFVTTFSIIAHNQCEVWIDNIIIEKTIS